MRRRLDEPGSVLGEVLKMLVDPDQRDASVIGRAVQVVEASQRWRIERRGDEDLDALLDALRPRSPTGA